LEELLDYSYLFDVRYGGAIWGDTWRNSRFEIYDTIDYETERYADFQLANAIMYSNTEKAVRYYILAFRRAKDNSDGIVDPDILLLQPLGYWQQEGANDAPAYFIAYNLACSYSLMNNVPLAAKWLRIAVRLNPELIKSYARGDRDLENVRGNDALFKEILGSEPASPVISNPAMNTIVAEYDRLRSALRFDASAVTRNKIEFRYVPANVIACAVVIYYEAKTDGTIRVEFIRNGMHSMTSIGMGIVNAPAGRGLIVVPISPRTSYDDFPVAGSETYFIARLVTPAETAEAHYSFPAGM
jgi:tetratricopeptide (TPR) repeat protein